MSAKEAFKSYVRSYDSHHLKQIFDVETLDLAKVATSFGFTVPPAVDLKVGVSRDSRPRKRQGGGGYGYLKNMNNPAGPQQMKRSKTFRQVGKRRKDERQFARWFRSSPAMSFSHDVVHIVLGPRWFKGTLRHNILTYNVAYTYIHTYSQNRVTKTAPNKNITVFLTFYCSDSCKRTLLVSGILWLG